MSKCLFGQEWVASLKKSSIVYSRALVLLSFLYWITESFQHIFIVVDLCRAFVLLSYSLMHFMILLEASSINSRLVVGWSVVFTTFIVYVVERIGSIFHFSFGLCSLEGWPSSLKFFFTFLQIIVKTLPCLCHSYITIVITIDHNPIIQIVFAKGEFLFFQKNHKNLEVVYHEWSMLNFEIMIGTKDNVNKFFFM